MELPSANNGFLGGLWSNIATDNNVKLFHKFSDEVGKTIGRHQVIHRPSIGRYTSIEDTRPRESLLTPAMRHSSSKSSLKSASASTESTPSRSTAVVETNIVTGSTLIATEPGKSALSPTSPAGIDPLAQVTNVVANAFLERTPFAIDDAGDDESDEDDEEEEEQDDVLDEVRSFGSVLVAVPNLVHITKCIHL